MLWFCYQRVKANNKVDQNAFHNLDHTFNMRSVHSFAYVCKSDRLIFLCSSSEIAIKTKKKCTDWERSKKKKNERARISVWHFAFPLTLSFVLDSLFTNIQLRCCCCSLVCVIFIRNMHDRFLLLLYFVVLRPSAGWKKNIFFCPHRVCVLGRFNLSVYKIWPPLHPSIGMEA